MIQYQVAPLSAWSNESAAMQNAKPTDELGVTGLRQFGGIIAEAYLAELRYPQAYYTYNEMLRRDPTFASMRNAIKLLARTTQLTVERAGSSEIDKRAAEFVEQNLDDMSLTVEDVVEDLISAIWFGWAASEIVYKRRNGRTADPASKYDDNLLGWRKFAPRRQSTLQRWLMDESGGVQGLEQQTYSITSALITPKPIPMEKLILFTADRDMGNPEGISILESAYEPWHYVKHLQIINGIGFERAFVGLPVFEYAEGYEPSESDKSLVASTGRALRVDEKAYVAIPANIKFHLETTTNTNASSLLETIKQYRIWSLMTALADFLALGTVTSGGSYALGQDKSLLFLMAVDGWLDKLMTIFNRYAIPRLFEVNAQFDAITDYPQLKHSSVQKPNLPALASFLSTLSNYITPDALLEAELRRVADLPEHDETTARQTANAFGTTPNAANGNAADASADANLARRAEWQRAPGLKPRGMGYFEMQFQNALGEFQSALRAEKE